MEKNVGSLDRIARIVAGIVLVGMAITGGIGAWGYIGLVPLLTGIFGTCPPYKWLGINTNKKS